MDHYIDLRLRPDPDFEPPKLMGALYSKLHRALFDLQASDIGVSFPQHKVGVKARSLGEHLRLHGTRARLDELMALSWLTGMRDHVTVSDVMAVPGNTQQINVARKQFNTGSPSRVRRYARRHDVPEAEAQKLYAPTHERRITLPFAQLGSRSTKERFCLFIHHGEPQAEAVVGVFNHYGLSPKATVPWF
ncbi:MULTISPECIES: type I-F CRISPR-associated endoribonuclease Cas6/Csy4 [unclassified Halomonas]|uniref:type I-F CRISPR-associated endoribonuclease Cas6/Csy4 n=1 Tax=unclassified Halomonas TaxID=2609666 RepID=UPI00209FA24C|nr:MULTISPECIES: type I-F CRISPR-associated endoribonuclease Cas6/Csy4 [unclassified Halomonas]MCP1314541.1 type I-F CRISPR-associated endoribonuclease Cas6/Csy4 [Halomonas sp. 707D7]MCP1325980.1 type I-F CRISPR-associated endoribonuclease Cas6/Csy4 [Halomonas sp. 707D4]